MVALGKRGVSLARVPVGGPRFWSQAARVPVGSPRFGPRAWPRTAWPGSKCCPTMSQAHGLNDDHPRPKIVQVVGMAFAAALASAFRSG